MKDVIIVEHSTDGDPYYEVTEAETGKRIGELIFWKSYESVKRTVEKKGYKVLGIGWG